MDAVDDGRAVDAVDAADAIALTGVRGYGYHGVFAHERREGQEFIVDVTLRVDTSRAARTDDVADTVDYGEAAERIVELIEADPVNLLETLAARIADALLDAYPSQSVTVTVHKPSAPIAVAFADVSVTIRRGARS